MFTLAVAFEDHPEITIVDGNARVHVRAHVDSAPDLAAGSADARCTVTWPMGTSLWLPELTLHRLGDDVGSWPARFSSNPGEDDAKLATRMAAVVARQLAGGELAGGEPVPVAP